jgi:branched-subunit amino acid ABC-type transport system permease component
MALSFNARLSAMSRSELMAGIGVALIVSGLVLRLLGSVVVLQALALLRSMSSEAITLAIHAFSLFEIVVGIAILIAVAVHVRRTRTTSENDNRGPQP